MKAALRMFAVILALATAVVWLVTGAHRGWTKTSVPTLIVDEITGIESPQYEARFVAGVDFLGAGLLAAGVLAGISLCFRNRTKPN